MTWPDAIALVAQVVFYVSLGWLAVHDPMSRDVATTVLDTTVAFLILLTIPDETLCIIAPVLSMDTRHEAFFDSPGPLRVSAPVTRQLSIP
jgi:hypothetical protein